MQTNERYEQSWFIINWQEEQGAGALATEKQQVYDDIRW